MPRRRALSLCLLAASPLRFLPSDETSVAPGDGASTTPSSTGIPALFAWADFDGDTRLDLAAIGADGRLQLLADAGQGRFEDVTERVGLAGVGDAALALWGDYDVDGRLDLFVGARAGASRLFRNEGGLFVDMSAASGLELAGEVRSAHWLDEDGDGRPDLHVATAERHVLFHGLEGGFFEALELPLPAPEASLRGASGLAGGLYDPRPSTPQAGAGSTTTTPGAASGALPARIGPRDSTLGSPATQPVTLDPTPLLGFPLACASSIRDQANPVKCMEASTTPALGLLYPLSTNLFVAVGGNVGIGTTSPSARLHVAGTARVTDTLTLAPSGDTALDVSTGSIYKGGALFLHTKGGIENTAVGRDALASVTSGAWNTAHGYRALMSNTTGAFNTASGTRALAANTTGFSNAANGAYALRDNTTGRQNTASGAYALTSNTIGYWNTASGAYALTYNTTGVLNTASGTFALQDNTTGIQNTATGSRTLSSNTTGDLNTATGERALTSNTTGFFNTASGAVALASNTTGIFNTATGSVALRANSTGNTNTASGAYALYANTIGYRNTACGGYALLRNTTGYHNAACGADALYSSTTGNRNTAIGQRALYSNTTGSRNIALGRNAGSSLTTGSDNIAIGNPGVAAESATIRIGTAGTQTRAFIAGIRGVTTGVANGIPVLIDSAGQLGTVSSSARFKEEIRDMGELTDRLLALRPVVFRYKPEVQAGERPLEYGLIAEEVAEVFPELVVYDDEGEPFTVKYHLLSAMLLNELKEQAHEMDVLHEQLERQNEAQEQRTEENGIELQELRNELARLRELESRFAGLEARILPAANPGRLGPAGSDG